MSGELAFGLWFFLCGLIGVWRIRRNFRYLRDDPALKLEIVCTLAAFAVALILIGLGIYSRIHR